jgi:ArsR family transcriptional regulator
MIPEAIPGIDSPSGSDDQAARIARALAHPARLRILRLIAATPGCIGGEIVTAIGLAQSTVSEHLRILKDAGLVVGEIDPPRICYSLDAGAAEPLARFLALLAEAPGGPECQPPIQEG